MGIIVRHYFNGNQPIRVSYTTDYRSGSRLVFKMFHLGDICSILQDDVKSASRAAGMACNWTNLHVVTEQGTRDEFIDSFILSLLYADIGDQDGRAALRGALVAWAECIEADLCPKVMDVSANGEADHAGT